MADATRRVAVQLQADTRAYQQKMNAALGPRSPLGKLAVMAASATAAAGAAIAGLAAQGVREFASLEQGMNEVFTLMPGMTDTAMQTMTDDVQAFAREAGVTTDEIVPALYDSISAGVPADNVFSFLETANQLAIGGVSDLNTAVDGLTSATNAYGTDLLSASEAADIMFTGVRQGKTTIDELARTVSATAPIAASLGVGFDETTAALAAMTSQGEPSQTAATKLRQLMAELSDKSRGAGEAFADIAGEDFPAFIAGGGTMQEAIMMLAEDAERTGGRVGDSFGSIEAAMAATMLASDSGREKMDENMTAMADAAGSAEAAFDQMDQGVARTWERIVATGESFTTEIGELLGPVVTRILEGALAWFSTFTEDTIAFLTRVRDSWTGDWTEIGNQTDTTVGRILSIAQSLWEGVTAAFDLIVAAWEGVLKPAWEAIAPAVEMNLNLALTAVETVIDVITGIFNTLAALLRGDFAGAWESVEATARSVFDGIASAASIWWTGVRGTFDAMIGFVNGALDRMFGDLFRTSDDTFRRMKETITRWWSQTQSQVQATADRIRTGLATAATLIESNLSSAWTRIRSTASRTWDLIRSVITGAVDRTKSAITTTWNLARDALERVWNGVKAIAERVWDALFGWLDRENTAIGDSLTAFWTSFRDGLGEIWNGLIGLAQTAFDGVKDAIHTAFGGIAGWVEGVFTEIVDTIGSMISRVVDRITSAWDRLTGLFDRADDLAADVDDIDTSLGEIDDQLPGAGDPLAPDPNSGITIPDIDETIMTPDDLADRGGLPEFARGGVVMRDTIARIGEAGPEAIVPLDRMAGMMSARPLNLTIELDRREIARIVAPALVDDLRLKTGLSGL